MVRTKIFAFTLLTAMSLYSQDTALTYKNYFGFNASRVSGIGLMYGGDITPATTIQVTGGLFRTSSSSFSSYGLEFQYNLQNSNGGRIYIGPALGGYNTTSDIGKSNENKDTEFVLGFAMGAAVPISGIFDNRLRASATLYYPTFYKDNSISVGFGATILFLF
jgi:hypothetical protein